MTLELTFTHIIIAIVVAFIMGLVLGYLIAKLRNNAIPVAGPAYERPPFPGFPTPGENDGAHHRHVSEEAIEIGAKDLMAMAESQGFHLTREQALQQAEEALHEALGIVIDDAPAR